MIERAVAAFIGTLSIALVPFVPALLRARIGVLTWLGLPALARLHKKHFTFLVTLVRIMMAIVGMLILWLAVNMDTGAV